MAGILMVTGGGRGIGAACALLGARRGYAVCVNYRVDSAAAERLVATIEAEGGRAIAVKADVADPDQVTELFKATDDALGPVTALINNAGLTGKVGPLAEAPPATLHEVVTTNLLGALYCAREAILRMSKKRSFPGGGQGGAIVNISSISASLGSPNEYVWYAASKGGIDSLTVGLAKEVAPEGIRVNAVAPGFSRTDIHEASGRPDRVVTDLPGVPLGRIAEPEEIAEPILWLLSDQASYATGAILRVGGGR